MENYVFLCEKECESDQLLELFEKLWFVWWWWPKATEWKFMRNSYKSQSCYRIQNQKERKISIWRITYYQNNWFKILPFKDWFELLCKTFLYWK